MLAPLKTPVRSEFVEINDVKIEVERRPLRVERAELPGLGVRLSREGGNLVALRLDLTLEYPHVPLGLVDLD